MDIQNLMRQCPTGSVGYTVIGGENLYDISVKFNTTVQNLIELNPGIDPSNIYGGLVICVPGREEQPIACPIGSSPYEVKSGETLAVIAQRFSVTVRSIIETNPDIDPDRLIVGQIICITDKEPQEPKCESSNSYVVQRGDTLYKIATAFNISVQSILDANPNTSPTNIYEGLILCIPVSPTPLSIVINVDAKRLTLYRYGNAVKSYPIAIGKPSTPTPRGTFTIRNKQVNPGGPFGTRWMGLSKPHYGIHGTNNPPSIGTAASNGCIRMYNKDVEELFNQVGVGTVVRIF